VRGICGYVPQIPCSTSAYPLIACNVNDNSHSFIEWEDPQRTYEYYDLTRDAMKLLEREQRKQQETGGAAEDVRLFDETKPVFSTMVHWPYSDNL